MNIPKVGSNIRVEVKNLSAMLSNPVLFPNEPRTKTFEGVVVERDKHDDPNSFCMTTGDAGFPVRSVMLKHVVSMNGASVDYKAQTSVRTVQVEGSKGNIYTVVINGDKAKCTCPQNTYRHQICKHIKQVLGE